MAKNYRLIVQGGLQEVAIDDNGNGHFRAEVDGQTYEVELESVDDNTLFRLWVDGERIPIAIRREGMTLEVFIGPDRYSAEIERSAGALTQTGPANRRGGSTHRPDDRPGDRSTRCSGRPG